VASSGQTVPKLRDIVKNTPIEKKCGNLRDRSGGEETVPRTSSLKARTDILSQAGCGFTKKAMFKDYLEHGFVIAELSFDFS